MEIPEKQKETEDKTQKRAGMTVITSVSISKEFADLIKLHKLSPTEVFRKGLGVVLYDMGVSKYQSPMNVRRSEYVKKFFEEIRDREKKQSMFNQFVEFAKEVLEIQKEIEREEKEQKNDRG